MFCRGSLGKSRFIAVTDTSTSSTKTHLFAANHLARSTLRLHPSTTAAAANSIGRGLTTLSIASSLENRSRHRISISPACDRPSSSSLILGGSSPSPRSPTTVMAPPSGPYPTFSTVSFYNGSTLSRLSWLRDDADFMNQAVTSSKTRFLLMKNLNPLTHKGGEQDGYLATVSWEDVKGDVLGVCGLPADAKALFGPETHHIKPKSALNDEDGKMFEKQTAAVGPTQIALVFLGIDETGQKASLPGQVNESGHEGESKLPAGTPYFALSLTYKPKGASSPPLQHLEERLTSTGKYDFVDTRALGRAGDWPMQDAAMVAQARALVDWNERQHFCPACSRRQYSLWGGYKRACLSAITRFVEPGTKFHETLLPPHLSASSAAQDDGLGDCPTISTLSNFCYPRTDAVVIMGVISPDGNRLLLGRQKKWPQGFYSCLAGFLEPGENIEEAVRREVLEESGIPVDKVVYHSGQSWSFPSQLMLGCFGIAKSDPTTADGLPPIRLDLDNELESAKWYTRDEILAVLGGSEKRHFSRHELERLEKGQQQAGHGKDRSSATEANNDTKDPGSISNTISSSSSSNPNANAATATAAPTGLRFPPKTAIAHVLLAAWARREAILPLDEGVEVGVGEASGQKQQQQQQQQAKV